MDTCQDCGQTISAARECSYCKGLFCPDHRLPENHGCPGMEDAEDDGRWFNDDLSET